MPRSFDVVVVGGGNAGLSAALAAREIGATVCIVERAPHHLAGGNSYFTAGAFRTTYPSLDALRPILPELSDETADLVDLVPYSSDQFLADMERITLGGTDPVLSRIVVGEAAHAVRWLAKQGVRWELLFARQSFRVDGRIRFWGNLTLGTVGGGAGLIEAETDAAERTGVSILYETRMVGLEETNGDVSGVRCVGADGERLHIGARAVILASGGFEADATMRATHLGPGWDLAKVRGTPYNTGDGLTAAIAIGAAPAGQWSGCHAIAWDAEAPAHGDHAVTNRFSRQAYPFGLVVNQVGARFLDEGADFRNYTYAKYGAEILKQPGGVAFQLFDATTLPLISAVDYSTADGSRYEADSLAALAEKIGLDPGALERTIKAYNASIRSVPFDPTIKDGRGTDGIDPPKSNWAQALATPPFVAFAVTCGITFTFGGVRIAPDAQILRSDGTAIKGLFACGEMVGGLFYHNYPGGSGLTAGTVFGIRAGRAAAREVLGAVGGGEIAGLAPADRR